MKETLLNNKMKFLVGYQEAYNYALPFTEKREELENTLRYIIDHLHHNCYMVCSDGKNAEVVKLQSTTTSPSLKPYLTQKINKTIKGDKRKSLLKTLRSKEWRIMQCVVKPYKTSSDPQFERFIADMKIPRGVFIFTLSDAQILREDGKEPWQMITGSKPLNLDISKHLPIFAYSGQKGYLDMPIPTYDDIELYFKPYNPPIIQWEQKQEKAVFRAGTATGCGYTTDTNQRLKLASMRSEKLDVGIVKKSTGLKFDPIHGLGNKNPNVPLVSFMSMDEQATYKYIIHVDGNVLAYRLLKSMLLGSVILRVKSPYIHWLDHLMKPNKHYIEIKEDLSDLEEMVDWCISNDSKCKKIAERSKKFAEAVLEPLFMKKFFEKLLR
jgi:hypothetical protein